MLLPQQPQRYARPLQLAMDRRPVGLCAPRLDPRQRRRGRKQPRLQRHVGQVIGQRPADTDSPRTLQAVHHGRPANR
jgi:hypothetical protein